MISDGGVVVTDEDWEINKGLSSHFAIEALDIPALLERGFHLKPRDSFPAAPSFLRGVGGVPSGSSFPPLWSLRFCASRIYGRGGPDGSHPASAAEKRRFFFFFFFLNQSSLFIVSAMSTAGKRSNTISTSLRNAIATYS